MKKQPFGHSPPVEISSTLKENSGPDGPKPSYSARTRAGHASNTEQEVRLGRHQPKLYKSLRAKAAVINRKTYSHKTQAVASHDPLTGFGTSYAFFPWEIFKATMPATFPRASSRNQAAQLSIPPLETPRTSAIST